MNFAKGLATMKSFVIAVSVFVLVIAHDAAAEEITPGNYTWITPKGYCARLSVGEVNAYTYGPCDGYPEYIAESVSIKYKRSKVTIKIDGATIKVNAKDIMDTEFHGKFKLSGRTFDAVFSRDENSPPTVPQQVAVEIVPGAAEIFLFRNNPEAVKNYLTAFPHDKWNTAIDYLSKDNARSIRGNETIHTVVFIIYQNLPVGANIETEHQFKRPGYGNLQPYRFQYFISDNSNGASPVVIINESRAGGSGGSIKYSLKVNGEIIAEKKVRIK